MTEFDEVTIGDCRLIHADCRDVLPTLGKFDLLLTDPPYGIDYVASVPNAVVYSKIIGDSSLMDLRFVFGYGVNVIMWGANCYPEQLPHRGRWICWDKRGGIEAADRMLGSPFELAWSSASTGYDKMIRLLHGGVVNADAANVRREHPTQKPIKLMSACLLIFPNSKTVLDPFMGSGTTGVACAQSGRAFTGIERERKYFDIAVERISRAYAQGKLFAPEIVKPQQAEITA